jgi:septal ring factor EnvC (AmiA/AmiB activator)
MNSTRSPAYVQTDEAFWHEYVHDRLRSLTTAVTLLAIIAVAALGVGLWALFAAPGDDASTDRVRRLEARVAALDARLQQRPAAVDLAAMRDRQRSLEQSVQSLEARLDRPDEEIEAVIEAVEATRQSLAQLEQRVADLERTAP